MATEIHIDEHVAEDGVEVHTTVESHGAAADEGVLASLGLNAQLFGFQVLNFAIVVLVLWFLILKPLVKQMEERKTLVDESIDNAKEAEVNLEMSKKKYEESLDKAKTEANKIVEKAHDDARQHAEGVKTRAKEEIEQLIDKAKNDIRDQRVHMVDEIKEETLGLVVRISEKFLATKVDKESDTKIIEEIVKNI